MVEPKRLTTSATAARVLSVTATVDSLIHDYAHLYTEGEVDGVTDLCLDPFLAIREGVPIHLPDREAVRDHFATMINTYRRDGAGSWTPVEIDAHELGKNAVFATVRWNARDSDGRVLRDTQTTYHLLLTPDGWRFLSYTNHF